MSKDLKKVEEVQSVLGENEQKALDVLIQAVKIATTKGCFELDDAVVVGNAKNIMEKLIK